MPLDRCDGHSHHIRAFLDCEAAKEAQLNEARLLGIERRECDECVIEGEQIEVRLRKKLETLIERDAAGAPASFGCLVPAGVVDEDFPHQVGSHGEEVRAGLPRSSVLVQHSQIGLMNERRALESVIRALVPEMPAGELLQLCIDERQQTVEHASLPRPEADQELSDWTRGVIGHGRGSSQKNPSRVSQFAPGFRNTSLNPEGGIP